MGSTGQVVGRLSRLLAAAREVADDRALRPALVRSTGLSAEGVAAALERHLETRASEEELERLARRTAPAAHVHVILSANVFTAPLRALAVAWTASERVSVRPSRRDPVFVRALLAALRDPRVTLAEEREVSDVDAGEIHVYGRDETITAVRAAARSGVLVRGHGAGLGVALVGAGDDLPSAMRAIAYDAAIFDQRGCLSPRLALVVGDAARALDAGALLSERLGELETEMPRGELARDEEQAAVRYGETMAFAGRVLAGKTHLVGVAEREAPLLLPPAGRHVHVAPVTSVEEGRLLLGPLAPYVLAIGANDAGMARALVERHATVRISPLGAMQRPPLDGPVDPR